MTPKLFKDFQIKLIIKSGWKNWIICSLNKPITKNIHIQKFIVPEIKCTLMCENWINSLFKFRLLIQLIRRRKQAKLNNLNLLWNSLSNNHYPWLINHTRQTSKNPYKAQRWSVKVHHNYFLITGMDILRPHNSHNDDYNLLHFRASSCIDVSIIIIFGISLSNDE